MLLSISMICWSSCSRCLSSASTPSAISANCSAYSLIYSNVINRSKRYLVCVLIYSHYNSSFLRMACTSLINLSYSLSSCYFWTRKDPLTFLRRCSAACISRSPCFFLSEMVCLIKASYSSNSFSTCDRCLSILWILPLSCTNCELTLLFRDVSSSLR